MVRLLVLALAAVLLAYPAMDVCIDDRCFPDSPVSPVMVWRVWLPVVGK